jgi:hypothetical protein
MTQYLGIFATCLRGDQDVQSESLHRVCVASLISTWIVYGQKRCRLTGLQDLWAKDSDMDHTSGARCIYLCVDPQRILSRPSERLYNRLFMYVLFALWTLVLRLLSRYCRLTRSRGIGLHSLPCTTRESPSLDRSKTESTRQITALRLRGPENLRSLWRPSYQCNHRPWRTYESHRLGLDWRY